MWNTFLGKHIKPLSAEVVFSLIHSRLCSHQFHNRLDNLTLHSTRTVTFKFVAVKIGACDLLSCIFMPVIRNRCSYSLLLFIRQIRYYSFSILFLVRLFCFILHLSFVLIVVQKKKNNSEPELCSGISILRWQLPAIHQVPVDYNLFNTII